MFGHRWFLSPMMIACTILSRRLRGMSMFGSAYEVRGFAQEGRIQ
jgi:hypothetical protein